jgi:hypothetical protein
MSPGTPIKPPAILPANPAGKPAAGNRAEMPNTSEAENASPQGSLEQPGTNRKTLTLILGTAGILAVMVALYMWTNRAARKASDTNSSEQAQETTDSVAPKIGAANPDEIATADELAKPWDAKKFNFVKPFTSDKIPAMVIRLPGGALWAFSLQEPFGQCTLEYVTDLGAIASQYGYTAAHAMIVNPCKSVVYDPLKVGPLGTGTWARGEIVHGEALRPPLSIDVDVNGNSIVAKSME